MSSYFSKLREQASSKLETIAKNIKENPQASLILGATVKNASPEAYTEQDDDLIHDKNSVSKKRRDENHQRVNTPTTSSVEDKIASYERSL